VEEELKAILKYFVDLKAIYELNLVPDSVFLMRLLMKMQESLLTFVGECIRHRHSWQQCEARVLKEYFALFIREMIQELVVFHFQERGCPLRVFIKEVVDATEFLQYRASGERLERILVNLQLEILAQAAFLPRPGSYIVEGHVQPDRGEDGSFGRAPVPRHGLE
jgi:hypothetical protein